MTKKLIAFFVCICLFAGIIPHPDGYAVQNSSSPVIYSEEELADYREQVRKKYEERLPSAVSRELPEGYDQNIIDDINNNNNIAKAENTPGTSGSLSLGDFSTQDVSLGANATTGTLSSDILITSDASGSDDDSVTSDASGSDDDSVTSDGSDTEIDSDASLSSVPEEALSEFKTEPVAQLYKDKEQVSLSTGALIYEKELLSLPGRNGLDLNISIRYNSDDAVITSSEYKLDGDRTVDFNNFAIGWTYGFPAITKSITNYGYKTEKCLRLSDGSTYKILDDYDNLTEDITLDLQNYLLDDVNLIRSAETKEYILTYSNGTKDYFDGTHGTITKREDRFGNTIYFEYEDVLYYRSSFTDYLDNPSFYGTNIRTLTKITDSLGNKINIINEFNETDSGKLLTKIKFNIGNTTYSSLCFDTKSSYNGDATVLKSITDGEGFTTQFNYEEKTSRMSYDDELYFNGSVFLLCSVKLPTGDEKEYEYTKSRRTYSKPEHHVGGSYLNIEWYEVYKVSKVSDSHMGKTEYRYEGDRSGYPYTRSKMEWEELPGSIWYPHIKYHTIVNDYDSYTIHTFDYKHNKIAEHTYTGQHRYTHTPGDSKWNVVVNNVIYRIYNSGSYLYIYSHPTYLSLPQLEKPYQTEQTSLTILSVKTKGSSIFVFYQSGLQYHAVEYNISSGQWSYGGSISKNDINSLLKPDNFLYTSGIFFTTTLSESNDTISYLTYNPDNNISQRWETGTINVGLNYSNYICSDGQYLYFKNRRQILKFDILSKNIAATYDFESISQNYSYYGFFINGNFYVYLGSNPKKVYEVNFETETFTLCEYDDPFGVASGNDVYQKLHKGSDGKMYYFDHKDEVTGLNCVYRFDPASTPAWELIGYQMMDSPSICRKVIMGHNTAYITNAYSTTDIFSNEGHYGGFENVFLTPNNSTLKYSSYEYNSYNQLIKKNSYVLLKNQSKNVGTEEISYINGKSQIASTTDILGNKTEYEYTDSVYYIPTSITEYADTDNAVTTINVLSEDKKKIISSTKHYDDRSIETVYTYDNLYQGNVKSETVSEIKNDIRTNLNVTEYEYDYNCPYPTMTVLKDVVTNNTDFESVNSGSLTTTILYDKFGNKTLVSEMLNDNDDIMSSYTYNKNGWLTRTTHPDGTYTKNTYTLSGGKYKIETSHNNQYYTIGYYDGLGDITKETEKAPGVSEKQLKTYSYGEGKLWSEADSLGNITSYFYDEYDRLFIVDVFNPVNDAETGSYTKSFSYDDFNLTKSENIYETKGKKTTYYDIAGRVIREEQNTDAGLNYVTYEYDHMGNVTKTTDAKGNVTTNTYNDMGQLVSVTNAAGTTAYEYDSWGNLIKTTNNNKTVEINEYDNACRLIKSTDAAGNSEYYAYDKLGRLIAYKDKKGQVTENTYDLMSRLTQTQTGTESVSYTYDSLGNQTAMTDSTGTTSYGYTYNNRLMEITSSESDTTEPVFISYSYNHAGNVTSVTDYAGNEYAYTYDSLYRTNTIKKNNSVIADYDYYTNVITGAPTKVTYPEGTVNYSYDNAMRVTNQSTVLSNNNSLSILNYTYDVVGNITQMYDDLWDETEVVSYTYDAINRLTNETQRDGTQISYEFDNQNNISEKTITSPDDVESVLTYTYNNLNQLTNISEQITGAENTTTKNTDFTYDANGNTLTKRTYGQVDEEVVQYTYNPLNQLTEFEDADGNVTTYAYDGTGMRVSKTHGENVQRFYWDRGYIVNENTNGIFTASNAIGIQGIFARTTDDVTDYLFKNAHGDVTDIVSDDEITNEYEYDAYGNQKEISSNDTNPFRYCGEYYDEESGLIYLRNRYYDPSIGRFITEDPIQDGMNWYAYCGNNPVMFVDPWGLAFELPNYNSNNDDRLMALQKLTDDTLDYDLNTGRVYISSWADDPQRAIGTELIRELIAAPIVCSIYYTSVNNSFMIPYYDVNNNLINAEIWYNPNLNFPVLLATDNGNNYYPETNYIVMGHELVHFYNRIQGNTDNMPYSNGNFYDSNNGLYYRGGTYYVKDNNGIWRTVINKVEELRTTGITSYCFWTDSKGIQYVYSETPGKYSENSLRHENGMPLRVMY